MVLAPSWLCSVLSAAFVLLDFPVTMVNDCHRSTERMFRTQVETTAKNGAGTMRVTSRFFCFSVRVERASESWQLIYLCAHERQLLISCPSPAAQSWLLLNGLGERDQLLEHRQPWMLLLASVLVRARCPDVFVCTVSLWYHIHNPW